MAYHSIIIIPRALTFEIFCLVSVSTMDACIRGHIDQPGEPETERFPHSLFFCPPPSFWSFFLLFFLFPPPFFLSTVDACLGGHIDQPGEPETERFQHSHHGGQGVVWAGDTNTLTHTHTHTHTHICNIRLDHSHHGG